jgi:hypothetical protein
MANKRPCDPILETQKDEAAGGFGCRYCGRSFATKTSMYRHVRQNCKIANSDEGMEKLLEHTLQRQMTEQNAKIDAQSAQIAELTSLLKGQLTLVPQCPAISATNVEVQNKAVTTVNTGSMTNNTNITNVTQNITIHPWSGESPVVIPASMLREAFTTNPRLIEYCRFSDAERVDAELAAPYALEALMDLVKRAHADPAARNVYLNPKRADQVLVFDESAWAVLPLVEAIRALFDSVAGTILQIMRTDADLRSLPLDVQASASWVPLLYKEEPEKYVAKAKPRMAAHLTNTSPGSAIGRVKLSLVSEDSSLQLAAPPSLEPSPAKKEAPPTPKKPVVSVQATRHLSPEIAAAALKSFRPAVPGEVDAPYIRALAKVAQAEVDRLVIKLWDAAEDNLFNSEDEITARAVASEYDLNPSIYD